MIRLLTLATVLAVLAGCAADRQAAHWVNADQSDCIVRTPGSVDRSDPNGWENAAPESCLVRN